MPNVFDQFDVAQPQATPKAAANLFDQFDKPPASGRPRITVAPGMPGQATFASRFSAVEPQMEQQPGATDASLGSRLLTGFENQGAAASQGTTPDIASHMPNLISDQATVDEQGQLLYRDPASDQWLSTDQNKHVAIRDPSDQRVKIFSRTASTDEGRLSAAGRILGTGLAAGAPTARPAIPSPTASAIRPKASDIFSTSKPYYRAFKQEAANIDVPVETAAGIADRLRGALGKSNFIQELAPQIYAAVGILDKGESVSLDALQNVKRVIGRGFQSPDKNVRDAAAVASGEIGKIIAEVAPTASQNLKTADAIHSTAKSVQELQRKADIADLRKGRAGYGGNAVNSMRQVLSPIVQRAVEGRKTGFKPDEIEAMRRIVEGTGATNSLRMAGQFSPAKGIIGTLGSGGAVAMLGPQALVIPALGAASNKLAAILTGKQIERLKDLVSKRSPAYAEAVSKSVARYEKAQADFVTNPSPAKFANYVATSRALASGLSRDGIATKSGDLMRSLQAGGTGRAEDDQQQVPGPPNQ